MKASMKIKNPESNMIDLTISMSFAGFKQLLDQLGASKERMFYPINEMIELIRQLIYKMESTTFAEIKKG